MVLGPWATLAYSIEKAMRSKKAVERTLRSLKLLQRGPEEVEGRLYVFHSVIVAERIPAWRRKPREATRRTTRSQCREKIWVRSFIQRNSTWVHTLWPLGIHLIHWESDLKEKENEQERIDCYKARILPKVWVQKDDYHNEETFNPVKQLNVIVLNVEKFTSRGWHGHHADIYTGSLNVDVDYGLCVRWENMCCKQEKIVYGLKQSPHLLNEKLNNTFKQF